MDRPKLIFNRRAMKKPRGDSKLKTMPPEQQAQVYEWLRSSGGTREVVRDRIEQEFGIKTNPASVSDFRLWYALSTEIAKANSLANVVTEQLKASSGLTFDDARIAKATQIVFEQRALEENDNELFLGLRTARQNDERLALETKRVSLMERRIKLLERQAELLDKAKSVSSSTLSAEEKAAKIKEIFGT